MPDRLPTVTPEHPPSATKRLTVPFGSMLLSNLWWHVTLRLDNLLGDGRAGQGQHVASSSGMELLEECHFLLLVGCVAQHLVHRGQPKMRNFILRLDPNRLQQMPERFPRSSLADQGAG